MGEKIYISDWLFNAGIVGFLAILFEGKADLKEGENKLNNGKSIYIGENYIELDVDILEGFSDKYFSYFYKRYKRIENIEAKLQEILEKMDNADLKEIESYYKEIKDRINNFSKLKRDLEEKNIKLFDIKELRENYSKLKDFIYKTLEHINHNRNELIENDVKVYLGKFYGQKSFLNRAVTSNFKNIFKKEFEDKIVNRKISLEKDLICINCCERKAKRDVIFDTGLSPFTGINVDSVNFFWNFKPKLPLCEICELIYFCSFGSFTESIREVNTFFFVNYDISILSLYNSNLLLQQILKRNLNDNIFVDLLNELLIKEKIEKSKYALESIAFIILDLKKKDVLPKVYSLNMSRKKAEYLIKNYNEKVKFLSNLFYSIGDNSISIPLEFLEKFLSDSLGYNYLSFLQYLLFEKLRENPKVKLNYISYDLQIINLMILEYIQNFKKLGGENLMVSKPDDQLWYMFKKGRELSDKLKSVNAENKIPSIGYKLLSHLRSEDTNSFMNLVLRLYLSYELEVPNLLVKALSDKDLFLAYGYSFLNGFLYEYYKKES
ncbi:MAG: type I-B CRISPR-associated protein Cas8b1/Cst1 [Elusimicrobiota bacterium]|nr:type I-B CRISPR-associated protein Cas8b1/Cst1 [Endomicrobiia bacterium]MDW8166428.1 type I-B CRISPR-associated protein Cas8b1/Cst1 [Elusimicrobiota bacterium]